MNLILLGAPGCGKGTQSRLISENFDLVHISTGQIFRDNINNKTQLGLLAESYINNGQLVPDEVTIDIVRDRLARSDCRNGYILDGFPRNLYQAQQLAKFAKIDKVLLLDVSNEEIKIRLLGRMMCEKCGEIYNKYKQAIEKCNKCGGELVSRSDDTEETVNKRIEIYEESTKPLIDYYKNENLLSVIDSNGSPQDQYKIIENELRELRKQN